MLYKDDEEDNKDDDDEEEDDSSSTLFCIRDTSPDGQDLLNISSFL